ncbi:MAG: ABC transporter permease [Myxococcales bacterium]
MPIATDLRHAARLLARSPGTTAVAALALAAGIGATAAIGSVVRATLLDPMDIQEPSRLLVLWETNPARGQLEVELSYPDYESWRDRARGFSGVAGMMSTNFDATLAGEEPMRIEAIAVSGNFFSVLGAKAALGRTLGPDDDRPHAPTAGVISHSLWQRRFGRDPSVLGRAVTIDGQPLTIVGVMPPEFGFPRGAQLWAPLDNDPQAWMKDRAFRVLTAVGRLSPGVTEQVAIEDLQSLAAQLAAEYPKENAGYGAHAVSFEQYVFGKARASLWILWGAVALLLLIACANVANVMLARGAARRREMGIRLALGSSRGQLVGQLLTESVLLAVLGGTLGIAVAWASVHAVTALAPQDVPRIADARLDGGTLVLASALSIASALLFGLIPALQASGVSLHESLQEGGHRAAGGPRAKRLRGALVIAEVALAVALVAAAGVLVRSFRKMSNVDPGYRTDNVLSVRLSLPDRYPDRPRRVAFYDELLRRVRALPGVESAAAVLMRPLSGTVGWDYPFVIENQDPADATKNPYSNFEAVSPDYFRTLGMKLLGGRDFDLRDGATAEKVVIVGESVARRYWPGQDAVGKRLRFGKPGQDSPWRTVIGVVKDARYREWEGVRPDIYAPLSQEAEFRTDLVIRTSVPPLSLGPAVRRELLALDKDLAVAEMTTLADVVDSALARPRANAVLLSAFGALALLLAALGIYGVMAVSVEQRTQELGIRLALGAQRSRVLRDVIAEALKLSVVGLVIGLLVTSAGARVLQSQLFEMEAIDPAALTVACLALLAAALGAAWIPALRATRVDPATALRAE